MKTASKVFVIISLIIYSLTLLALVIGVGVLFVPEVNSSFNNFVDENVDVLSEQIQKAFTEAGQADLYAQIQDFPVWMLFYIIILTTAGLGILECIAVIIISCIALNKIDNAKNKGQIIAIGIFEMLFANFIGGILMLCIPKEDFDFYR